MGRDDSPELHLADILKYGGELIDPELARVWVYDIIDVVHDLEFGARSLSAAPTARLTLKCSPAIRGRAPAITTTPPAT